MNNSYNQCCKQNNLKSFGFSLIELMVTVGIIGVLGSIAIPNYLTYTTKAKVSNAMAVLEGLKKTATENYMSSNSFTTTTESPYADDLIASSKIAQATSYGGCKVMSIKNKGPSDNGCIVNSDNNEVIIGYVQLTFNKTTAPAEIQDTVLGLVAIESGSMIRWQCVNGDETGNKKINNSSILPTVCS